MPYRTASALLALAISTAASAQTQSATSDDPDGAVTLPRVVVTGTPLPDDPRRVPADIGVLTGDEKLRRQTGSLGASLDHLPGVTSIGTGSQVGKPVIRGFSGNRIRILANGIGLDYQQYGVRHPPNIDPFVAERIEVVRGVSSILYGSDAIGGAINVISRRPPSTAPGATEGAATAVLRYGSAYEETTAGLSLDGAYGPWGLATTWVSRDGDGLETADADTALETGDPTDPLVTGDVPFTNFSQVTGDINLGFNNQFLSLVARWEAYRSKQNFVVPDPPPPDGNPLQAGGIGQNLDNDIVQLLGELRMSERVTVQPTLSYVRNLRQANPGPPEPLPTSALPRAIVVDLKLEQWIGRVEVLHGPVVAGFDGRVGVEVIHTDQQSRGVVGLSPGGTTTNVSVFALQGRQFGDLTLNAGARFDHRTTEAKPGQTADEDLLAGVSSDQLKNDYQVATGSVGAVYRLTEHLSLAANLGRGFRAPSLFDLYVDGEHGGVAAVQQGDPNLAEETSLSLDASVRYYAPRTQVKLTGYIYDVSDYIFLRDSGELDEASGLPVFRVDQNNAEIYGADALLSVDVTPWLTLTGTAEYVDGDLDTGEQVPLLPPLRLSGEAMLSASQLGPFREPYLTLGARYADGKDAAGTQEPFSQFDTPPPPFGTASTESYTLVDLSAGARWRDTRIDLSVQNVLDEDYVDFLDTYKNITLGPGRNIMVTLTQSI